MATTVAKETSTQAFEGVPRPTPRRYVVVPETQMPYEDREALTAVIRFVGEYQPDEVVQIGDLLKLPQSSHDTKSERRGRFLRDADHVKRSFLEPLRRVFDGPLSMIEGSHDTGDMLEGFDVTMLPNQHAFAPGWVMAHGHLATLYFSPIAGNTALNAAKRFGTSVVMGHTGRLGIGRQTTGYGADLAKTVIGVEVGTLVNMKLAGCRPGIVASRQQGFGLLTVAGDHVDAHTVPIMGRKFTVRGQTFAL